MFGRSRQAKSNPHKRHGIRRMSGGGWLRAPVCALVEALEPRTLLSVNVTVNAAQTYQTIEGFGTSLADWTTTADSAAWQQMYYQDLGASQLRINMNESVLEASPGDLTTPVTLVNNLQTDINMMNFNQGVLPNEGPVAAAAQTDGLGPVEIIGSLWTPPNWMKGPDPYGNLPYVDSNGDSDGGSLIDTPANLQQFGLYVAAWVKGFQEAYGVSLYAISIQNEPTFSEPYDSCVYTPQIYVDAIKAVASAFQANGITTKLEGPELVGVGSVSNPGILEEQMAFIDAVEADPVAAADLNIFSIHGYADDGTTPGRSPTMWGNYWSDISGYGLESWMTEMSGEPQTAAGAIDLASNIQDALVKGNVSAWDYYLTSDGESDYQYNLTVGTDTTTPTYNAAKQFFKYIRPGAVRISATPTNPDGVYVSAFLQSQQQELTTEFINEGTTDQTISLNLQDANVSAFTTVVITSAAGYGVNEAPVPVVNGVATFTLPAQSIMTLQGTTANITAPPTVVNSAAVSPNPAAGTTVNLSSLGSDQGGAANLIYTWAATTLPAGASSPLFSTNGTNAANDTIATLSAAGDYVFTVTMSDYAGFSVTSSVSVQVDQTTSSIAVSPGMATVSDGGTRQFSAVALDQFGAPMVNQPGFSWSVNAGGIGGGVNSAGLYAAPANGSGYDIVVATNGSVQGAATVTVAAGAVNQNPIAYDSFIGSGALNGFSDGAGWSGAWQVQSANVANPGYQVVSTPSLAYGNLSTSGGYLTGGSDYLSSGRPLDVGGAFSADEDSSTGLIGKAGTTVWFSALLQLDVGSLDGFHLGLHRSSIAWYDTDPATAASLVEVGYFGGANLDWSLDVGGTIVQTNKAIVVGQTALVVIELNYTAGGDTVSLYVNPASIAAAPPAFADASVSAANVEFSNVSYYGGSAAGDTALDEIRVGGTYAAVTPLNTPPAAPTGLTATTGSNQVELNWNSVPNATSYTLSYGTTSGGPYTTLVSGITATTYTVIGLSGGTTYYFVVAGANTAGTGVNSGQVAGTPFATTGPYFYPGFTGAGSQLALNGAALINGSNLVLTNNSENEDASAYYNTQENITGFTTQFDFQLTGTWPIGNGFTFVIQRAGINAKGVGGSGLGYGASAIGGTGGIASSVAVKFDFFNNQGLGNDTTGLYTDGICPDTPAESVNLAGTGINLLSYDSFSAAMTYNGTNLTVVLTDLRTNATATQTYAVNIASVVGGPTAWIGFTAGDGSLPSNQLISSWIFNSLPAPAVSSFTVNDGNPQRSMVDSLTVAFTEPVTLGQGAFTLNQIPIGGGALVSQPFTLSDPLGDQKTYVLTMNTANGSLPDGIYNLAVNGAAVQNAAGLSMNGTGNYGFYRMYGDFSGAGKVGSGDLLTLLQNFNKSAAPGSSTWYLDGTGSGIVNSGDLLGIIQSFNKSLAPTASIAPVSGATAGTPLTVSATASAIVSSDVLSYQWTLIGNNGTALSLPNGGITSTPTLTFTPSAAGNWTVGVTVTDTTISLSTAAAPLIIPVVVQPPSNNAAGAPVPATNPVVAAIRAAGGSPPPVSDEPVATSWLDSDINLLQ